MRELLKTAKIHRLTAKLCLVDIEAARPQGLVGKKQRVQNARFSRAIRAEDQRDWLDWHALRRAEGFEVGDGKGGDHDTLAVADC